MSAFPDLRLFRLSNEGVRCDPGGLFVGGEPVLERPPAPGGGLAWTVIPADRLNRDLSARYGFPVDLATKRAGLAGVARALERGDLARAQVGALLLRFPDPPPLVKGDSARDSATLAKQLVESGLLKADWDASKHPRTGEPPNPGWFAPKDDAPVPLAENDRSPRPTMTDVEPGLEGLAPRVDEHKPLVTIEAEPKAAPKGESTQEPESEPAPESEPEPAAPQAGRSPRNIMKDLRAILKAGVFSAIEMVRIVNWADATLTGAIDRAVSALRILAVVSPAGVDLTVLRALEEARAAADPPKTLAELQTPPTQNVRGYDDHHMVQRNDGNIAKSPIAVRIEKFGWNVINAPSNRVWIPRVKHRLITDWYNMTDPKDPRGRLRRQVVSDLDYDEQLQDALNTLRMFGVLQ